MLDRSVLNDDGVNVQAVFHQYAAQPMNVKREQAFEKVLLTKRWYTVASRQLMGRHTDEVLMANERLMLGAITYLVDNQRYLPIFTSAETRAMYLASQSGNNLMPDLQVSTANLMQEIKEAGLKGVILEPGTENIPVTYDYWASLAANDVLRLPPIQPLQADRRALTARLTRFCQQLPAISKLWAATVQRKAESLPQLVVIAQYQGDQHAFDRVLAPQIAQLCVPLVQVGQQVLVGTTHDPLGAKVEGGVAPLYLA